MNRSEQLADEIRQIAQQYQKEVSTKRRAWPLSIKERVIELRQLGLSRREVFKMTGIPEPTVWIWTKGQKRESIKEGSRFVPVKVTSTVKSLTVRSDIEPISPAIEQSLTVELPGGLRVLGMSIDTLILLSRRLAS